MFARYYPGDPGDVRRMYGVKMKVERMEDWSAGAGYVLGTSSVSNGDERTFRSGHSVMVSDGRGGLG